MFNSSTLTCVFFLMIRRPPRSTQGVSSAASDVYKRQSIYWNMFLAFFGRNISYQNNWFFSVFFGEICKPYRSQNFINYFFGYFSGIRIVPSSTKICLSVCFPMYSALIPVSYTHHRAHETSLHLVCRLLLEKKKKNYVNFVQ
eukprot:TRINITY_DN23193_c0_g1_i2.p1 TRINITY_DN23193_c0_g1~~TRINITY_DN23193_c0_g1_i2.p1  ORF type:complete len:143 (+),score=30.51 TRINITY_DN23193_c0_g1_i2:66-494(+)